MVNYQSVMDQIAGFGLLISGELVIDGCVHRVPTVESPRDKKGWYVLHEWLRDDQTWIVGSYGVWSANNENGQKIKLDGAKLSSEESAALRARLQADRKRALAAKKAIAERAALRARQVWSKLPRTAHGPVDYLATKGIEGHGARYTESGALVVPMTDVNGMIHGLQFILPKTHERAKKTGRNKENWPLGHQLGGHFYALGVPSKDSVVLLAEGFATAASLRQATGLATVCAFTANNLLKVALELKQTFHCRVLVCADDDYLTDGNPGVTAAGAAALAVGGAFVVPQFPSERNGQKITDFNDLAVDPAGGHALVAAQIAAKLQELGWSAAAPLAQGGGVDAVGAPGYNGRRNACAIMALDDLVERYIPIDDGTGKYVWDTWTRRISTREQMIVLLPAGVRGDDIKRHPTWQARGAYFLDEIGFDPSERDATVKLNTWRGWPMEPVAGDCDMLLDTIYRNCGEEANRDEVYQWLLDWMAYPLQYPGAKMDSAVVMHGPQGTGKTTIAKTLAKIYGNYSITLNQRGLEDKFNSDWADSKLLIVAEEVVTRAEMYHIKNELKDLVTGDRIRVNPKNVAAYYQRNCLQVFYLSNEDQPIPIDNDDRRHLVVYNPPAQSEDFYLQLHRELENGGVQAFYHYLLQRDLSNFHPKRRPPMTAAKQKLMELSKPSNQRFIDDWVNGETEYPVCPCLSSDLYEAYTRWCRKNGESKPRPANHFAIALERKDGWEKKKARVYQTVDCYGDSIPKTLIMPPQTILERNHTARQESQSMAQWLTVSWLRLNHALRKDDR